jgi:hypothetical protein
VRVLPHNNVKIRLSARKKSIFHANNLKTYHSKGEFQTFEDYFPDQTFDFQKQGGEEKPDNYFNEKKTIQKIILSHWQGKSLEKKRKKVKAQKNFHHPKEGGEDQEKQTNKLTRKHFQHSKTSMNATC